MEKNRSLIKSCVICSEVGRKVFDIQKFDYLEFVGMKCEMISPAKIPHIDWSEVENDKNSLIIDCRPQEQYNIVHFEKENRIVHVALSLIQKKNKNEIENAVKNKVQTFDSSQKMLVFCRSGVTSQTAVRILNDLGFISVNIIGGLAEYKKWSGKSFNPLT